MRTTQLRRDPFARVTLVRVREDSTTSCAWCGNPKGKFSYFWEDDSGRYASPGFLPDRSPKQFCSVGCWESYHS